MTNEFSYQQTIIRQALEVTTLERVRDYITDKHDEAISELNKKSKELGRIKAIVDECMLTDRDATDAIGDIWDILNEKEEEGDDEKADPLA